MDSVDRLINQAVVRDLGQQPIVDDKEHLADQQDAQTSDLQERFNLILAHYLAGAISLGRAAELLELPWLDLRTRFRRLDVPLRTAPTDLHEARLDVEVAEAWAQNCPQVYPPGYTNR
jgi:predicted HTH domain antitoxin